MFRDFFARPWIKKEVLSYLFDKEKYQKTPVRAIRAQVIRFINYEELEPNELMSAEIHDNQYYIKCFFTDESLYEFNRHSIDYMVGTLIIIRDYTFSHEIDSSKNKHECFLTIKNFTYTKNITDLEEHSLQIKYICEEMEVKETPKHIDHPGWNGFRYTFYSNSVDIRTVPLHQYKLMSDIPGWNFSQRNHRNNDLCVKIESNEWSPGSPESPRHDSDGAISLNEEDIAIIMKGNYEERENYRSDTLDDEEVHFERTKRKYVDSNNDDISSKKHKNSPSTFCSYV